MEPIQNQCSTEDQQDLSVAKRSLTNDEEMKRLIIEVLKESPLQRNPNNIIKTLHNEFVDGIQKSGYKSEIKDMMYAFGEHRHTNPVNITILEQEMKRYLTDLIRNMIQVANKSSEPANTKLCIGLDNLAEALIPCCKSIALVQYLSQWIKKIRKYKEAEEVVKVQFEDNESIVNVKSGSEVSTKKDHYWKPNKQLQELIDSIDPSWSQDRIREERIQAQCMTHFTEKMSPKEYIDWQACCKVSFVSQKKEKFVSYLKSECGLPDIQVDVMVIQALAFLAKEHIQNITSIALENKALKDKIIDPKDLKEIVSRLRVKQ